MISVSSLAKSFGSRTLFARASFQLNPGERYGLVGAVCLTNGPAHCFVYVERRTPDA